MKIALALAVLVGISSIAVAQNEPSWRKGTMEDPMHGGTFDTFILRGSYVYRPDHGHDANPTMSIICAGGKYRLGFIDAGAILDTDGAGDDRNAFVEIRFDDKPAEHDRFSVGNDFTTIDFNLKQAIRFLTGNPSGHPSDPTKLVHKLMIGASEAFASYVLMQFDMPEDNSQMVKACGFK